MKIAVRRVLFFGVIELCLLMPLQATKFETLETSLGNLTGVSKRESSPLLTSVQKQKTLIDLSAMAGKPITGDETSLNLSGSARSVKPAITNAGVAALAQHCPKLEKLYLFHCAGLTLLNIVQNLKCLLWSVVKE